MKRRRGLSPRMLAVYFIAIAAVAASTDVWVEVQAPRFVIHRHNATLRCEHNADPEHVYKVVFFKDGHRIMQYINGRDPPYEMYNVSGVDLKLSKLTPTSVTLTSMDFSASGAYACEIALENPLYFKLSKFHEITVIFRQKHRPKIRMKNKKINSSNDILEATCHSAPAHPAPHLAWFINNVKVDESLTIPNGVTIHRHHHLGVPLSSTSVSLNFPLSSLQLVPNQTVDISCLATIPSYVSVADGFADIQNNTISVNVVRLEPTPTRMPDKIVASDPMSTAHKEGPGSIMFLIVFLLILTSN